MPHPNNRTSRCRRPGPPPALEVLEDRTLLDAGPLPAPAPSFDPSHLLVRFRDGAAPAPALAGTSVGRPLGLLPGAYEVDLAPGVSVAATVPMFRKYARIRNI